MVQRHPTTVRRGKLALAVGVIAIGLPSAIAVAEPLGDEARIDSVAELAGRTPEQLVAGLVNVAETYPGGLDAVLSMFTTGPCAWTLDLAAAPAECRALIADVVDASDAPMLNPQPSATLECIQAVLDGDLPPDDPCLGSVNGLAAPPPDPLAPVDEPVQPPPDLAPPVPGEAQPGDLGVGAAPAEPPDDPAPPVRVPLPPVEPGDDDPANPGPGAPGPGEPGPGDPGGGENAPPAAPPGPGDPGGGDPGRGGGGNAGGGNGNVGGAGGGGNPPGPVPPFCCSAPPVYFPPMISPCPAPRGCRPPGPTFVPPPQPPLPPLPPGGGGGGGGGNAGGGGGGGGQPALIGPRVIALGDSVTSGHIGGTGPNRNITVCEHPRTSYADNLKVQLGIGMVNVAHSGASTTAVLNGSPYTDPCGSVSQQARPQIADAVAALQAAPGGPGRRNVSVVTAGLSDTNLVAVLRNIIIDPPGPPVTPQACRDRIHGNPAAGIAAPWNGPVQAGTIAANIAKIVIQLGAADPHGHVRPVLYANFGAGDPLLPSPCAAAVALAVGALNQWITLGAVAGQLALAGAGGNPFQVATVSPHCARPWAPARNFVQDSLNSSANGQQVPGYPNPNNKGRDDIADCLRASLLGSHDTPVGRQLDWFLLATRFPAIITAQDYAERFTPAFQLQVPFAAFRATVVQFGPLTLRDVIPGHTPHMAIARVRTPAGQIRRLTVVAHPSGRIASLTTGADPLAPEAPQQQRPLATSWNAVNTRLAALAPVRGLFVSQLGANGCSTVHSFNGAGVGPVGSVFKTFILGELADQVRAGHASWDQPYQVRARDRVTPLLSSEPIGSPLSLRTYAADMIWFSDNTATDHLLFRLGRTNVEAQQAAFGTVNPAANMPFPSTREAFVLKYVDHPALLSQYLALNAIGRRALLDGPIANIPTPSSLASPTPRAINTVEWFYSPRDMCGALAGLYDQAADPALAPIADIMSISDFGLGLSAQNWRTTWFKGGSEGGLYAIAFLAEAADGKVFTVTALVANPNQLLDESAVSRELRALARSSFALAAGTGA